MTTRRAFLLTICGDLLIAPLAAHAQAGKVRRIGVLSSGPGGGAAGRPPTLPSAVLRQALEELGYVEGKNVAYVGRAADGRIERLPELAVELVRLRVDIILTTGSEATRAAKQATTTVPIVFLGPSYPVEEGLVASFARPGGNITGITLAQSDHVSKQLQLLRDVVPTLADVAVLWNPANPGSNFTLRDLERAAGPMQLTIRAVPVRNPDETEAAVAAIARVRPGALIVLPSPVLFASMQRIGELAIRLRIPSITALKQNVELGFLLTYGADIRDLERRVAGYVEGILKGASPADLPVERPTKFELAVNLKTAKAIGVAIPQAVLLRADEVIQ